MKHPRLLAISTALLMSKAAYAAGPDGVQAQRIADQFIATKSASAQDGYEATQVVVADLDKDGQDEVVVMWTLFGPTYSDHGVAVLLKRGHRYAASGETREPLGLVEGMTVADGTIQLKTKWPGSNDPRCCPSVAKTLRYRWTPGKLTPVK